MTTAAIALAALTVTMMTATTKTQLVAQTTTLFVLAFAFQWSIWY